MQIHQLKDLLKDFDKNVIYDQDLKKKSWFNIGGKSKVFYKAENLKDLIKFLKLLDNREKIFIIGAGSNTLISDNIFDGVVIKLSKNFNRISLLREDVIISGSGVLDNSLSSFAAENNLSGFEFLSCIPGTVGGGIKMNAGCFGKEFKDILLSIQAIDQKGNLITIPSKEINFDYRKNDLSDDLIFLSASFKGVKSTFNKVNSEVKKFCEVNFNINFPLAEITDVRGDKAHEIYKWAKENYGKSAVPKWNFYKIFINKDGKIEDTFSSLTNPISNKIISKIEELLNI